jgi:hypothetical protein
MGATTRWISVWWMGAKIVDGWDGIGRGVGIDKPTRVVGSTLGGDRIPCVGVGWPRTGLSLYPRIKYVPV